MIFTTMIYMTVIVTLTNPHLPGGPFHRYQLDETISYFRGV